MAATDRGGGGGGGGPGGMLRERLPRQRASTLKPRSIPTIAGISLRRPFVSVDTTDSRSLRPGNSPISI